MSTPYHLRSNPELEETRSDVTGNEAPLPQAVKDMMAGMWQMQLQMEQAREERRDRERTLNEEKRRREQEEVDRIRMEKDERDAKELREWREAVEETARLQREKEAAAATKLAQLEMDRLQMLKEQREANEKRQDEDVVRRKNERLLRSLQPMKEKEDLETYIQGLEHTLTQCQVEEEEWLFYLTANMTGKYSTLVTRTCSGRG